MTENPPENPSNAPSRRIPNHPIIPDGIPADFDPDDASTWGTPPPANPPDTSPDDETYYEGWMFDDARYDIGSGRFRPLYVLLAGVAIATMLPIMPTVSSAGMLVFAVAIIVWRLVVVLREVEQQRHPSGVSQMASPVRRLTRLEKWEWALYAVGLAGAGVLGIVHGLGAFVLMTWIIVSVLFWRTVVSWSYRVMAVGLLVVTLMLWAARFHDERPPAHPTGRSPVTGPDPGVKK